MRIYKKNVLEPKKINYKIIKEKTSFKEHCELI